MAEFKDRFKEALEASGMTRAEIVMKTGIKKESLSNYLSGYCTPNKATKLITLASVLNVNPAWLSGCDVPMQFDWNAPPAPTEGNAVLASRLQMFRTRMNYTKRALAQALELEYTTYTNYEYGAREPGIRTLIKIADFYHVTVDDLIGHIPQIDDPPMTERKENTMENEKTYSQKERETLLAALATIRDTCKQHDKACTDCPLFVRNNCRLRDRPDPSGWQLVGDPSTWRAFL